MHMDRGMDADAVIRLLGLEPHPEGGHYRETFRDEVALEGRAASTAIYFLLKDGEVSRWHRVDAAEVWHWYAGAPLLLDIATAAGESESIRLGTSLAELGRLDARRLHGRAWLHVSRLRAGAARFRPAPALTRGDRPRATVVSGTRAFCPYALRRRPAVLRGE
jgi:predicted cupin superfamily sugar epimerase